MDFMNIIKSLDKIHIYPEKNYRLKIGVSIKNIKDIKSNNNEYNDEYTDKFLIEKINCLAKIYLPSDIYYAWFQKSNYCNNYSIILLSKEKIRVSNESQLQFLYEWCKTENVVLLLKTEVKTEVKTEANNDISEKYISENKYIENKYYNFTWMSSPQSFIQINKNAELWIHDIVSRWYLTKSNLFYGLGGQMGIYSKYFTSVHDCKQNKETQNKETQNKETQNKQNTYINLTDSESIYNDCINNGQTNTFLINYNNVQLKKYFTDSNSTLLINISKNGLKDLANDVLMLKCQQIIYIACSDISINRDLKILCPTYKIENMEKIDQFPNTKSFSYIINLLLN